MTREAAILNDVLRRVAFRIGVDHAIRWTTRTAAIFGLIVLGWAFLTMIFPLSLPFREVAILGLGGLAIIAVLSALLRRPSPLATARITDHRLGLADRLSTAVELLGRPFPPRGLIRLQIADAVVVAQGVSPRSAAPISLPREAWAVAAIAVVVALWVQFFQGWTIPGLPAARNVAVIHREGRTLTAISRQLETTSRARGLPEARRAAPSLLDLGQRLQAPRVTRPDALRMLQDAGRQLQSAQSRVERRLGGAGLRGTTGSQDAHVTPSSPAGSSRLQQTIQELRSLTGQLRGERDAPRDDIAQRLGRISEALQEMNAPLSTRRDVASARREVEQGRPGSAASALGDAMQDLEGLERMLGDDQALGDAKRQVQQSSERIAQGGPLGTGQKATSQSSPGSEPPSQSPGPNPVTSASEDAAPPPPGPNQGSLPGEGRGSRSGAPTPRLGGTRAEEHLTGRQGEGTAITRDLLAPGRVGAPQLPAVPVPADVAHQNDRAVARDPLPPAYLTLIRRYFETLERSR
ncbi:MAG TPA: hypothetical protein VFP86_18905 [bacterium]|nr:hypothetical protein [bacterium]